MVARMMVTWMCWGMGIQSLLLVTAKFKKERKDVVFVYWRDMQERVH